jgi:peptidoglycan hydrolase-like protein with peptidoglycan-binding domain
MSNDKLAEQLAKLKETLAKWEKELIVYSKWAIENDGILTEIENKEILCIKSEIKDINEQIVKIEKAKGTDNGNPGKTFTADTKKAWNFNTFQEESEQVMVDKDKLTSGQIAYFQSYEKVAQTYINRMAKIYEGKNNYANSEKKEPIHKLPIPLTGKMLADAALKTFVKYGNDISKVVPVELMLAQCQGESHFGTVIPRKGSKNSPFNVGVYDTKDAAFLDQVDDIEEGIEMYYDLMAEDYLSAKSADELDDNFVNERGLRYASSTGYERMMKTIEDNVKSVIGKNGLKLPNADDLANNNPAPIDNNDSTTHTNQEQNITGSINSSVGIDGVNNSDDVKIVQKLLNEKINAGLNVDGDCGNDTKTAIKAFQQKTFGWEDGLVEAGGKTWKALSGAAVANNQGNNSGQNQNNNGNNGTTQTQGTVTAPGDATEINRTGGWAKRPAASKITASSEDVKAIMAKIKGEGSPSLLPNVPKTKVSSFNENDKYLKDAGVDGYLNGKSQIARPGMNKTALDKAYGYIDASLLPANEDAADPQRKAFAAKYIVSRSTPFPLNGGKTNKVYLHKAVADSFIAALTEVLNFYGLDLIKKLGIDLYAGGFVFRKMRGSSSASIHAYGCAVDFASELNLLADNGQNALFNQPPYSAFFDILEKHGWHNQGRNKDNDYMHFQAVVY